MGTIEYIKILRRPYLEKNEIFEFLMRYKVKLNVMACPLLNQHKCGYCVSKINNVKNFSLMVRHIIYILKLHITHLLYWKEWHMYEKYHLYHSVHLLFPLL